MLLLERLDESDVLLLGVGGRDTLVDQLLPCVALGLALLWRDTCQRCVRLEKQRAVEQRVGVTLRSNMPGLSEDSMGGSWVPCLKSP